MQETFVLHDMRKPKKMCKLKNTLPVLIGLLNTHLGKERYQPIRILLDSSMSASIILGQLTKKLRNKSSQPTKWKTKAVLL